MALSRSALLKVEKLETEIRRIFPARPEMAEKDAEDMAWLAKDFLEAMRADFEEFHQAENGSIAVHAERARAWALFLRAGFDFGPVFARLTPEERAQWQAGDVDDEGKPSGVPFPLSDPAFLYLERDQYQSNLLDTPKEG